VRVTIAPDGRVTSVEQVSATSPAFFQATQRHALSRWRFKPATVDGRPDPEQQGAERPLQAQR
jgi:protein TonB